MIKLIKLAMIMGKLYPNADNWERTICYERELRQALEIDEGQQNDKT